MNWVNEDDDNVSPRPQANDGLSQMLATIRRSEINSLLNNNISRQPSHNNNNDNIDQRSTGSATISTGNSAPGRIQDISRSRNSPITVPGTHPYHQATVQRQYEQRVVGDRQSMGSTSYNNHRNQTFDICRSTGGYHHHQQQTCVRDDNNDNHHQQQQKQQQPTMNPLLRMMEERMAAQAQQQQQEQATNSSSDHQTAQLVRNTITTTAIPQQQHQPQLPSMTNQEKVRQISKWNATKHPQQITRFNGFGDSSRSIVSVSSCGSGSTGRGSSSSSRGGRQGRSSSRGKKRSSTATYYEQHQLQRRRRQTNNSIRTVGEGAMRHSFNSSSPRGLDRTSVSLSEVDRLRIANPNRLVQQHQQQYNFTTAAATAASALGSVSNPHQSTSQEDMNKLQAETLAKLRKRNLDLQSQDSLQSMGSRTLSMASSNSSTNKMG